MLLAFLFAAYIARNRKASVGPKLSGRSVTHPGETVRPKAGPLLVLSGDEGTPDGTAPEALDADRELAFTTGVLERARRDPEAALRWAADLPEPRQREAALERVCAVVAEWDPALAVDCAKGLDFPWSDRGFLPGLVRQWAAKDREAAIAWALRLPESADRDDFLTFIALAWAQQDPAAAVRWVGAGGVSVEAREAALLAVLPHWFDRDLPEAEAWLAAHRADPGTNSSPAM